MMQTVTTNPYRTLTVVAGVALAAFIFWGTMNVTGFCWREGRYLSDEEKIRNAIKSFYLGAGYMRVGHVERKSGKKMSKNF